MSKDTTKPSPNGHAKRPPPTTSGKFAQATRLMTRRPIPAKPATDQPPARPAASRVPPKIPVPPREDRYLSDAHIAELEASGIPAEYALDNGVYTEDDPEKLAKLLNWKSVSPERGSGLVFLSHDEAGTVVGVTVKFDVPRVEVRADGRERPVKYEQQKGCPPVPHIPPATRAVLNDPTVDLCLTEGWKKAVSADYHGIPCIALPGVTMWSKGGKLLPALDEVVWEGRTVYIVFDSDAATNPNVRREEQKLAAALTERGAVVTVVRLPKGGAA